MAKLARSKDGFKNERKQKTVIISEIAKTVKNIERWHITLDLTVFSSENLWKSVEWRKLEQMLLSNKWEDLDAAGNESTSFLFIFIDREFFNVALEFELRDFRLDWALFVDLVVAGNFHGFLGWIWIFLNGFYCFWFSDRSRSSVKVVVNREFWWVLGSNPYFLIRPPVSCFFVFF